MAFDPATLKKAFDIIVGILTVVTGVKNYRIAQKLKEQGQDILATKRAEGGKIPIIYGRRRVGSTLLYMDTDAGNSKELFVIYGLCLGEVDSIELDTIEINGVPLSDTSVFRDGFYTGSDKIASGAGSLNTASQIGTHSVAPRYDGRSGSDPTAIYRMVFNAHHGADDQSADPMLVASQPARFSSLHKLKGIAYIAASFQYDKRGMFTSVPELTVVVKGRKLYDPRLDGSITGGAGSHRIADPSTYEWSNNAALCLLDYIHGDYGKGLDSSLIDLLISIKNSGGTVILDKSNVIDPQRFTPHTENTKYRIYTDSTPPEKISKSVTFSATNNDATITATCSSHGASVDDRVLFSGAVSLGGNITATVLNKLYVITSVADANTFTFEATNLDLTEVKANSSDTGNGGASAVAKFMYEDESGSILTETRRFMCDGVVDTNETVLENARELLSNMRGFLNYIDGKYSVLIEDTGSSTFSITEDHIIDSGIKIRYEDKANKLNKAVAKFFNAQKKYEADTRTVLQNDNATTFANDDGGEELETVIELPYITNPYNAHNMAKAAILRSRNQKTIAFIGTPRLLNLTAGDIVDITYTPYNLSSALYRVESIDLLNNGLVSIQMLEYIDIYSWQASTTTENVGDEALLPTGTETAKVTSLAFTDTNASSTGRPFLSWSNPTTYPSKEFRVAIVDSSGNEVHNRIVNDTKIDLNFIKTGSDYVASVTTINSIGAESEATTLTFSVSDEPIKTADVQDDAITDAKVSNLSANSITSDTLDSARINVDTLAVKHFANVSADIVAHDGVTVPLSVFGSEFQRGSTDFTTNTTALGSYLEMDIENVRNNAKYQAIWSGVYGDCTNGVLEYSVNNGTTYVQAAGGIQNVEFDAGTFRTYIFVYNGTITGLPTSGSNTRRVKWRVRWITKLNSTYQSLYVFIDNTQ